MADYPFLTEDSPYSEEQFTRLLNRLVKELAPGPDFGPAVQGDRMTTAEAKTLIEGRAQQIYTQLIESGVTSLAIPRLSRTAEVNKLIPGLLAFAGGQDQRAERVGDARVSAAEERIAAGGLTFEQIAASEKMTVEELKERISSGDSEFSIPIPYDADLADALGSDSLQEFEATIKEIQAALREKGQDNWAQTSPEAQQTLYNILKSPQTSPNAAVSEVITPFLGDVATAIQQLPYVTMDGESNTVQVKSKDYDRLLTIAGADDIVIAAALGAAEESGAEDIARTAAMVLTKQGRDGTFEELARQREEIASTRRTLNPITSNISGVDQVFYEEDGELLTATEFMEKRRESGIGLLAGTTPEQVGEGLASQMRRSTTEIQRNLTVRFRTDTDRLTAWDERYGGSTDLAFIGLHDFELAERISADKGTTDATYAQVTGIMDAYSEEERSKFRWASDPFFNQLLGDPTSRSGGTRVFTLPNELSLREGYRENFQALLLRDPTDAELDAFVSAARTDMRAAITADEAGGGAEDDSGPSPFTPEYRQSVQAGAPGGGVGFRDSTLDTDDLALANIRSMDEYNRLFGNRRQGVSEAQYANQFTYAAAGTLGVGGETAIGARLAGMRTGDVNTTIGRANFSEQGLKSNTLQGKLAAAAERISRRT